MIIVPEDLTNYPEIPVGTARNIAGERSGRLEALYRVAPPPHIKGSGAYWICKCDCGNYTVVQTQNFLKGRTKSCGCLGKENST